MNKPLLVVAGVMLGFGLAAQQTIFVSPNGTADGSAWTSPANLHSALAAAQLGDQLWLSEGTYLTSTSNDRNQAFVMPGGVRLLGGFDGDEKSASQRNPAKNLTKLSGEIGEATRSDNAYSILILEGKQTGSIVDGITLSDAYANGAGAPGNARRAGGAVLIASDRSGEPCNPTFVNCIIQANYARDGGGVYIDGRGSKASPNFISCAFRQNEADLDGGAIYNDARRHGEVTPSFTDCTFEGNVANYGGAIFNQATKGNISDKLANCTFTGNHAYVRGPSLYNIDHQGEAKTTLLDCVFEDLEQGAEAASSVARND